MNTSLPEIFTERMRTILGKDFDAFANSLQQPFPVSIRNNPLKRHTLESVEKIPWTQYGFYLTERPEFVFDPLWHAGAYYVQEASSMFLEQIFSQLFSGQNNLNILDLCAAPGGKSTHLLSLISDDSLLISNETIGSRNSILRENIIKWGYPNVAITQNDARDFQRLPHFFDIIIVDAPCSGEGLFRKDNRAREEWNGQNVAHCSMRQKRILNDILPSLKPNGILIYSTCTFNETENEEQVNYLENEFGFEPIELSVPREWNIAEGSAKGCYRFYPHRLKGEGFFISALRKKNEEVKEQPFVKNILETIPPQTRHEVDRLISDAGNFEWIAYRDAYHFFPKAKKNELNLLLQKLKVTYFGTEAFVVKQNIIPQHALAMSVYFNRHFFEKINLEKEAALRFLRKEAVHVEAQEGWNIVYYMDVPLGFVKKIGTRINNYYPVEWRLRKK
jgi:16S rRNA C967 or C1407 C5-methylase (RsmB/RsmF family)/NOL1/NOP2/fmu family ribosome biogenesis protein